jgi:hypothetical protein
MAEQNQKDSNLFLSTLGEGLVVQATNTRWLYGQHPRCAAIRANQISRKNEALPELKQRDKGSGRAGALSAAGRQSSWLSVVRRTLCRMSETISFISVEMCF